MQRISCQTAGLALILAVALAGGVQAQQHQQHHPSSTQAPQRQPPETGAGTPAPPQMMGEMQGMMEHMQGMMEHMQGMMEHMQGMRGHGGMMRRRSMRGMGGMMGRRGMGMMAQEEDDEEESPQRGMMGRHMERLAQQLELTDEQQAQIRALLRNHAKEAIRLRADIGVLAVDVRQLLDTDPVDLPKVKQLFQSMAVKEADLRVAHITLMQEINKLLTPDQQKQFRPMRERMGGMMGHSGMRGRGQREK